MLRLISAMSTRVKTPVIAASCYKSPIYIDKIDVTLLVIIYLYIKDAINILMN